MYARDTTPFSKMLSSVAILLNLFFFWPHVSSDLNSTKRQYAAQVAIPYKAAINILAVEILEMLANESVPKSPEAALPIAKNLSFNVGRLQTELEKGSNGSSALAQNIGLEIEVLVVQGSNVQRRLDDNDKETKALNADIKGTEESIQKAQEQVNKAQKTQTDAENSLREEEDNQHKQEHGCLRGKRRKRNWFKQFGNWVEEQGRSLESGLCGQFNRGAIDKARESADAARDGLNSAQKTLKEAQDLRQQQLNRRSELEANLKMLQDQKNQLSVNLQAVNKQQSDVRVVGENLKRVSAYLGSLFGRSKVLSDVVKGLIDMETVIDPLRAIANQVFNFSGDLNDITQLRGLMDIINATLPMVIEKLPKYTLVFNFSVQNVTEIGLGQVNGTSGSNKTTATFLIIEKINGNFTVSKTVATTPVTTPRRPTTFGPL